MILQRIASTTLSIMILHGVMQCIAVPCVGYPAYDSDLWLCVAWFCMLRLLIVWA